MLAKKNSDDKKKQVLFCFKLMPFADIVQTVACCHQKYFYVYLFKIKTQFHPETEPTEEIH